MNKVLLMILVTCLLIITVFGFTSLMGKVEMQHNTEAIPNNKAKKISYGEGEYNKILIKWAQTDQLFFERIMKATAYTSEILLLREYKGLMEELDIHRQDINKIEPPIQKQDKHQQLISMNEYAYLTCLNYFKNTQKSHYYFKRYVSTYYQFYLTDK